MLYKIKNKKTGEYFVKVLGGTHQLDENKNCLKITRWTESGGTILDTQAKLNRALNSLTKVSPATAIRPYPYLPTYTLEDLEIVEIKEN